MDGQTKLDYSSGIFRVLCVLQYISHMVVQWIMSFGSLDSWTKHICLIPAWSNSGTLCSLVPQNAPVHIPIKVNDSLFPLNSHSFPSSVLPALTRLRGMPLLCLIMFIFQPTFKTEIICYIYSAKPIMVTLAKSNPLPWAPIALKFSSYDLCQFFIAYIPGL